MAGSSLIGNLAVNLQMETAAFQRSASLAEKRAQGLGAKMSGIGKGIAGIGVALAGGVLIGGITEAVTGAFELGSAMSEAAAKMGVTVEGLQRLRVAAQETGVSNEQLDSSMAKLNKSLGELQLGTKSAVDSFALIGLSADDLKGKAPDQALRLIADALNKIPDPQQRIAIGSQLMGKSFAQLVPLINGGSAALDEYAEKSKRNGEISAADAQKLDDLADTWDGFKVRVGIATATIVAAVAGMAAKIGGSMAGLSESMVMVHNAVRDMAVGAVDWVGKMVTGISSAITDRLNKVWDGAKARIQAVKREFYELYDAVVGHSYIPDMVSGIADSMSKLQEVLVDPTLNATSKAGAAFQQLGSLVGSVFGQKAGGILNAIGQMASALGPLLGGGNSLGTVSGGSAGGPTTPIPHFARGGSGVFGGRAGIDKNVLSMNGSPIARVSKGEHFSVSPSGNSRRQYFDLRGAVMTHDLVAQMNEIGRTSVAQGAMLGAAGGQQATMRQQRRQIP